MVRIRAPTNSCSRPSIPSFYFQRPNSPTAIGPSFHITAPKRPRWIGSPRTWAPARHKPTLPVVRRQFLKRAQWLHVSTHILKHTLPPSSTVMTCTPMHTLAPQLCGDSSIPKEQREPQRAPMGPVTNFRQQITPTATGWLLKGRLPKARPGTPLPTAAPGPPLCPRHGRPATSLKASHSHPPTPRLCHRPHPAVKVMRR